jgi:hypothetical protein
MTERKGVAVRAPFFLPLYPLFVIRFQSQKKADLAPIRCGGRERRAAFALSSAEDLRRRPLFLA